MYCGILWWFFDTGFLASQGIVSQIVPIELTNPSSIFQFIHSLLQTGKSPPGGEQRQTPLIGGGRPTAFSIQFGLIKWSWFCLLEHRRIRIFSFLRTSWISLVLLFRRSKCRRWKSSLRRVTSTPAKNPSKSSDPLFEVLRPNIGFKPVFKPVDLNIVSYSSIIKILVNYFWSR